MGGAVSLLKGDSTIDMVIPCMTLPDHMLERISLMAQTTNEAHQPLEMLITGILEGLDDIKGQPKSNLKCLSAIHKLYIASQTTGEGLPENFKHFGTGIDSMNVAPFLRSNPFFAMALKSVRNEDSGDLGFELNTLGGDTWTARLLESLPDSAEFVNATFDKDLNIVEIKARNKSGDDLGKDKEFCCTKLLALMSFAAGIVHAVIHVFHCAMVTGLYHAVGADDDDNALQGWAAQYYPMVWIKYEEVHMLLLGGQNRFMGFEDGHERAQRMVVLEDMFRLWGTCKTGTDFVDKFIFSSLLANATKEEILAADILQEYVKHTQLAPGYASEVMGALDALDHSAYKKANKKLLEYYNSAGDGNVLTVETLVQWTELMCVTAILHGATISASRYRCTATFLAQNFPGDVWSMNEIKLLSIGLGTICGIVEGCQVYSSSNFTRETRKKFGARLRHVLLKYDALRSNMQAEYFDIVSARDDYGDVGWILNDWVLEEIDGRQLTITTYI